MYGLMHDLFRLSGMTEKCHFWVFWKLVDFERLVHVFDIA